MTGRGDVAEYFECVGSVAFDVSDCNKENHDGVSGLVGAGVRAPADDALEVCAFKIPAGTVGGPDLCFQSAVGKRKAKRLFLLFLH